METHRTLIVGFLTVLFGAFAPTFVWAYKTDTHQGLTKATIESYEKIRRDAFTDEEEQAMIKGSLDEDKSTRPLQHFYDPVNNRGLTVLKSWEASRYWAEDTVAQANYCAWGICFKRVGFYDTYFSSPTDFSWERAIYEYAHDDKTRAAEALGHVLHLMQDSTVPAHVRNDQHLNHEGFGDMDPYEEYTGKFGLSNIAAVSIVIIPKNDLASIFIGAAGYANNNFLSKDTLFRVFSIPSENFSKIENGFVYSSNDGHILARVKEELDFVGEVTTRTYYLDDPHFKIQKDYWSLLSTKAITSGAEVIDLFFREVEKERKTLALKEKNKSAFEKQPSQLALAGFGLVKSLYGSSLNQEDVEELLGEGSSQVASANAATSAAVPYMAPMDEREDPPVLPHREESLGVSVGNSEPDASVPQIVPRIEDTSAPEVPAQSEPTPPPSPPTPVIPPGMELFYRLNAHDFQPGGGAWGGGGSGTPVQETQTVSAPVPPPAPVVVPQDPVVSAPLEGATFATTSITAWGTAEPGSIVTLSYMKATTTVVDASGNWSFAVNLAEGPYVLSFTASDGSNSSNTVSRDITVDLTPPNAPTASAVQCAHSLSASRCLIAGTTAHIAWDATADAVRYAVFVNGTLSGEATTTSLSVSVIANSENDITVTAYDAAGNAATSSTTTITAFTRPVIINELSWAGTAANAADEWIELKNTSSYDIDMSRLALTLGDGTTVTLSGTLPAATSANNTDLYLIERRAEATTGDHALTVSFNMNDAGDRLALVHPYGTGTTTVDKTPATATCGGWCAGSAAYDLRTSVQFGTTTAILAMERIATTTDSTLATSWRSSDGYTTSGSDAAAGTIYGTPGTENSAGLPVAGWYCSPDATSITANQTYTPQSSTCTYLSGFIGTSADRYGGLYKGIVGNATDVNVHSLGKAVQSTQSNDITAGSSLSDSFFVAIWEIRTGPAYNDVSDFHAYFQHGTTTTGSTEPPHANYRVIEWGYGG